MRDENIHVSLHFKMVKSSAWMSGLVGKLILLIGKLAVLL